jgi:SAM-dependent methyltransferase
MHEPNIYFYEQHAERFCEETLGVDMTSLYQHFLPLLPKCGRILDAGCGSGRDARAFLEQGFSVTAFDASPMLAEFAEIHLGQPVHRLRFQDLTWHQRFDGIWACASLLHVPENELADAVQRLSRSLKNGGILYASFKYGSGERACNGRRFTDLDETGLADLLRTVKGMKEVRTWTTGDLREGRETERWLNTLLCRTEDAWANS